MPFFGRFTHCQKDYFVADDQKEIILRSGISIE